ncbi:MAG TPA: PhzF family phenazine biosynthesis protein [Acidobacteriota bacterium]|jgi:PhzF family phenazine biosynthesis protein|nr:PhzF family phenazine biosynthesis protein [Acidobacteriota bacterium]
MKKLQIFQVDAFADQVFKGNPAAIVLVEGELSDDQMQSIATENNLSETAFVTPGGEGFGLRWFTPNMEVDLCGHATLASAYVLFETGLAEGGQVSFETLSGCLKVVREGDWLSMDFPSRKPEPGAVPAGLPQIFGASPTEVLQSRDLLLVFDVEETVAKLEPDFAGIAALDAFAVIVTAPGNEVDFVSRFFAPKAGIPEDPVTGSAHCTLIPFWADRLGKSKLLARQISKRGGDVKCENRGDRVIISGRAVEYLRGEIHLKS